MTQFGQFCIRGQRNMANSKGEKTQRKRFKPKGSKRVTLPYWFGNYPFKPQEKEACLLSKEAGIRRVYGKAPHDIEVHLHVSTDKITCSEFHILPGEYFDPPDIHTGDEVYYILRGTATIFDPDDGTVYLAREGDFFLIPEGTWHQTFNFFDEELEILTAFGKNMVALDKGWPDIRYTKKPAYFEGGREEILRRLRTLSSNPLTNEESPTQDREMMAIRKDEGLDFIQGRKNHVLVSFYVSNATLHSGVTTIPPRGRSDSQVHKGDEVVYCLEGNPSVLIVEEKRNSKKASPRRYEIRQGNRFLIPEGTEHSYVNFSNETARLLFTVAPDL